jgi:hypothetical protein
MKYKTIKLSSGLSEKQIEKELERQRIQFEKEVQKGTYLDGNITLNEFSDKWFTDYAELNLKPKTIVFYKKISKRILVTLGHKKLDSISPTNLMEFYKNLTESKIRLDYKYTLKTNIIDSMPDFKERTSSAAINSRTIRQVLQGKNTDKEVADKICNALSMPIKKVFDVVDTEKKLSSVTVHHHHRLVSTMLNTAVQWQLIHSNPAERVKPPTLKRKEAKYYDIDEVNYMLKLWYILLYSAGLGWGK